MSWYRRLSPLGGLPQAHIEPTGNAYSFIETARAQGFARPRSARSPARVAPTGLATRNRVDNCAIGF
jgi:hypothetical protein